MLFLYSSIASSLWCIIIIIIIHIRSICMLQIQQHIFKCIMLYNFTSFREEWRAKYVFIEFVILTFLFNILVCFISSRGFMLPSGVIFLFQYGFVATHLLCAVIVIYVTLWYIIGQTIQLCTYRCVYLLLNELIEERRNMQLYCLL